jgi:hypothetical protein
LRSLHFKKKSSANSHTHIHTYNSIKYK